MNAIAVLVNMVASLVWWALLIYVIMGWLLNFNVLNYNQPLVRQVWQALQQIIEPMLRPIRRMIPNTGGIDFSPVLLLLLVHVLRVFILRDLLPVLG